MDDFYDLTLDDLIKKYRADYEDEIVHLYCDGDDSTEHFTEKVEKYSRYTHINNDEDER